MQTEQLNKDAARDAGQKLFQIGKIGNWPVFHGFPMSRFFGGRGMSVVISTHWQCGVTVHAYRAKGLEKAILDGIALAIRSLEKCEHTPDSHKLRAYALKELRAAKPAIVPHPCDL